MSAGSPSSGDGGADEASLMEGGRLPVGIVFNGQIHRQFIMRPANVEDNFYALEQIGLEASRHIDPDVEEDADEITKALGGTVIRSMRTNLAMFSQQIMSLGTIPKQVISYSFLQSALDPVDFDVLWEANQQIKKKLNELPESGASSGSLPHISGNVPA